VSGLGPIACLILPAALLIWRFVLRRALQERSLAWLLLVAAPLFWIGAFVYRVPDRRARWVVFRDRAFDMLERRLLGDSEVGRDRDRITRRRRGSDAGGRMPLSHGVDTNEGDSG
jgi:hypothetical protein